MCFRSPTFVGVVLSVQRLDFESRGEPKGITRIAIARAAVRVHKAEVTSVGVIRRTLPPISGRTCGAVTVFHPTISRSVIGVLRLVVLLVLVRITP